jgi:hypothetical protein
MRARKDSVQHGSLTMYARGCRCDECVLSWSNKGKKVRAKKAGRAFVPEQLSTLGKTIAAVKRGDKIGEYDFKGLSREDLVLVNEAFADIDIDTGNAR